MICGLFILCTQSILKADEPLLNTPYLGVTVNAKDDATIINVIPNSPADQAGFLPGDFIISFADKVVHRADELQKSLAKHAAGETVMMEATRGPGEILSARVTLVHREDQPLLTFPAYKVLAHSGPYQVGHSKFDNSPTVYYFTATWCGPCQMLAPDIEKFYQSFKNKIRFLAVAISDDPQDLSEFNALAKLRRTGHYSFTIIRDSDIWEKTNTTSVPTIYIVNSDGYIVGLYHGQKLAEDNCLTLKHEVQLMIKNTNPTLL